MTDLLAFREPMTKIIDRLCLIAVELGTSRSMLDDPDYLASEVRKDYQAAINSLRKAGRAMEAELVALQRVEIAEHEAAS